MSTSGEHAARSGNKASMADNREQVAMTEESRTLLTGMLRNEMRAAVADGIADAMTDENAERFWKKGFEIAQEEAANRAGLLVLGGIKRALGIAAVVLAVWMLAGAPAAKAIWVALTKAAP